MEKNKNNKIINLLLDELKNRGLLKDIANPEAFEETIKNKSTFYVGIDPTGFSLHLGHFSVFNVVRIFNQVANIKPIFVVGGFTASIGDPSGKDSERKLLDSSTIEKNVKNIKKQIIKICNLMKISEYEIVNNLDFYKKISITDLFQKFGKFFNLSTMLSREMVSNRLETGISYTEFSYQVFQAIDYLMLNEKYNTTLEIGGSDQWGNIASGIELIRKVKKQDVSGLTTNLVVDKDGKKIGKTSEGEVIWLEDQNNDLNKYSYFTYQYFFNLDDETTYMLLLKLTSFSIKEIQKFKAKHDASPKNRFLQQKLIEFYFENILNVDKKIVDEIKVLANKVFNNLFNEINKTELEIISNFLPNLIVKKANVLLRDFITKENIDLKISGRQYDEFQQQGAIKIFGNVISSREVKVSDIKFMNNKAIVSFGKKNKFILVKK